jgi:hypothetical protein
MQWPIIEDITLGQTGQHCPAGPVGGRLAVWQVCLLLMFYINQHLMCYVLQRLPGSGALWREATAPPLLQPH